MSKKVYFVHCMATGRVKCGIAVNPMSRLSGLQTGSPTRLALIATLNGDEAKERAIHQRLSPFRVRGEWFEYNSDVLEIIIEEVTAHVADREYGLYLEREKMRSRLPQPHVPP